MLVWYKNVLSWSPYIGHQRYATCVPKPHAAHCGQDHDRKWVRYYADRSNEEIYQWLTAAGVRFDLVVPFAGNSVPRGHGSKELGVGLVGTRA